MENTLGKFIICQSASSILKSFKWVACLKSIYSFLSTTQVLKTTFSINFFLQTIRSNIKSRRFPIEHYKWNFLISNRKSFLRIPICTIFFTCSITNGVQENSNQRTNFKKNTNIGCKNQCENWNYPKLNKNAFLARILQDSSKNIFLGRILQDNAILVRFLQVNTFLARTFQAIHFLQDTYKDLARYPLFARILQ